MSVPPSRASSFVLYWYNLTLLKNSSVTSFPLLNSKVPVVVCFATMFGTTSKELIDIINSINNDNIGIRPVSSFKSLAVLGGEENE